MNAKIVIEKLEDISTKLNIEPFSENIEYNRSVFDEMITYVGENEKNIKIKNWTGSSLKNWLIDSHSMCGERNEENEDEGFNLYHAMISMLKEEMD